MEDCNGADRVNELMTAPSVIAKNSPVLEAGDCMLDACTTFTVAPPHRISNDPPLTKSRDDELGDASVATIGKYATMVLAQGLDGRASIMNGIITIARSTSRDGYDVEIGAPHE